MKIDTPSEAPPPRSARDEARFQELLARALPPSGPFLGAPVRGVLGVRAVAGPLPVSSRGALAHGEHLGQVRQGLSAEAHRLQGVRGEAHQRSQERVHHRLAELLAREFAQEPAAPGTGPRERAGGRGPEPLAPEPGDPRRLPFDPPLEVGPGTRTAGAAPGSALPAARAQALLELVEKIEVLVRAQRPALAMRLGGTLDATVEVERTGVREVALRIQGHRGPLRAEDLARVKAALTARGLTLRALSST